MIRKYADRANWGRILERQFNVFSKNSIAFSGHMTLFEMIRVREPLIVNYPSGPLCIVNNGYKWIQHFPDHAGYILTSVYDSEDRIVQWYIDICKAHGVTEAGVPWYDDLYLDIVKLPTGELFLLDQEELEEALQQGIVRKEDYEFAWTTARLVMEECKSGSFDLTLIAEKHLNEWLEVL
ncbi:MAG: hypothetical protein K0Q81_1595 [Paenibacillus sp.]|nr:hypothetical protein [Paenibacillus sp.]